MMNYLDLLVCVFVAMSVVSLLAIALMLLMKNELVKKICSLFLSAQGAMVCWINAMIKSVDFPFELTLGWGLGAVSVAALIMEILGKRERTRKIARIMAAVAAVIGTINAFS